MLFVDTGAFVALAINEDQYNDAAKRFWNTPKEKPRRVTTSLVVSEAYSLIRSRRGFRIAIGFLEALQQAELSGTLVRLWPQSDWDAEVTRLLSSYSDQVLSYVDAASLVACRRVPAIEAVFSFDHHLGLTGLPVVPGPVRQRRKDEGERDPNGRRMP